MSDDLTRSVQDGAIYRLLVENVTDHAIYMMTDTGLVSSWNAGAEKAKQYTAGEIIGRDFACFYTPEDRAAGLPGQALAIARSTGVYEGSGWRLRKDGSLFWADVVIEALRDPAGGLIGFVKIARDTTARHQAEIDALERERQFRYLVQGVTDYAIYMLDLDGHVSNWNAGAELIKGYSEAEIVGRHFSCFYTPQDRQAGAPEAAIAQARREGRFSGEGWRVRKDGTRLWAQVIIDLIEDDSGRPIGLAKITRDRTEQRQAQAEALESERRFRHLVQGVTDYAIYMLDMQGLVTNWNAGAARAKGYTAEEIVGHHFSRFFTPEDLAAGLPGRALATAAAQGRFEGEGWRLRKDGSRFWAHVVIDQIRDDDEVVIGFAKITRDITRQKADADRIAQVSRTLDLALSNMKHGLCVFDPNETLQLANRRFLEMFDEVGNTSLIGLNLQQIVATVLCAAPDAEAVYRRHRSLARGTAPGGMVEHLPSGSSIAITHAPLPDGSWVSTFEDVTESRRAEATIAKLAAQDSLTGLANRRAFNLGIAGLLQEVDPSRPCAVLLIDLDDFKTVNDNFGHAMGDRLLRHVADCISRCIRAEDLAARFGGDEFAVVLGRCTQEQAVAVVERLIRLIRDPAALGDEWPLEVGASVGIVMAEQPGCELELLLGQADLALYEAKAAGKNALRVYDHAMSLRARSRRDLEHDLREAVQHWTGFAAHYQPQMDVATGRVVGREALLRWTHPRRGPIPPSEFIAVAEEVGLIGALGRWVLARACADAAQWPDEIRVAVNVSSRQLGSGGLARQIAETLAATGLPAARLEIEVTETTLLDDGSGKLEELRDIQALGVSIALDDFGIGYSSLSLVRAFPFDRIKIDGSFVRDAVSRADCAAIVGVVVDLGRRLDITVVAEGVETGEHLELARFMGCHEVQGYLLGHPAPDPGRARAEVPNLLDWRQKLDQPLGAAAA